MRSDMYKVIVERPRSRGWKDSRIRRTRRQFDWEGPSHAGIRQGVGRPHLNENLNPLRRFLHKQVGRPWNKVLSEIAANIDRRNTVQLHVYAHINDYIAVNVEWKNGAWFNRLEPDRAPYRRGLSMRQPLYVDPRTGLIRRNKEYESYRRDYRARLAAQEAEIDQRRRPLGNGRCAASC